MTEKTVSIFLRELSEWHEKYEKWYNKHKKENPVTTEDEGDPDDEIGGDHPPKPPRFP